LYTRFARSAAALVLSAAVAGSALAQTRPSADDTRLVKDFIHYVKIDSLDMAASTARDLLDKGLKPAEFAGLIESTGLASDFVTQALKAQRHASLEDAAAGLLRAYNQGKLDRARDAAEISRNISLLTGTQRNRIFATERLLAAGEYAVPQLFQALVQNNDRTLQAAVRRVLVDLGHQAIIPLATALPGLDPVGQEVVAGVLGDIQYQASLPFLYELRAQTRSGEVRAACESAIRRIAGGLDPSASPSALFTALAEEYYAESLSLTSFPNEPQQLLWAYNPGIGLLPTPIDTSVYHEAMAMRMCERALTLDAGNGQALSLWLASNFRREIESPKEYDNPAYAKGRPDAMYYAVAAGPVAVQRVLARAIDGRATVLARRAIAAIERTAGATGGPGGLWDASAGRNPLLEALRYPNRRVQYEAALAIGAAQPRMSFDGAERVVPILASAVRDAAARFAVVVTGSERDSAERANDLADLLRAQGYDVLPPAPSLADAQAAIAEKPGIDLIVTWLPARATDATIGQVRGSARLAATPVLALLDLAGMNELGARYLRDQTVRLARSGSTKEQIAAAAQQLVEAAVGGSVSADEARTYKERSLAVLRDLAVSESQTLNVADATAPLVNALPTNHGAMKLQIAEVLSHVAGRTAQVALMDDALAAKGEERVAMLGKVAASARRFGNLLEPRQVNRVVDLALQGAGDEATAAAALMGSLNLPNDQLIPLIIGKPGGGAAGGVPSGAGASR
jgi:hypothetical protein